MVSTHDTITATLDSGATITVRVGCHVTPFGDAGPAYIVVGAGDFTDEYHYGISPGSFGRLTWSGLTDQVKSLIAECGDQDEFIAAVESGRLDD